MKQIFILLTLIGLSPICWAGNTCENKLNNKIEKLAHNFMEMNGLIFPGEEIDFPNSELKIRWNLVKVTAAPDGCFAIMSLCFHSKGSGKECGSAFEVVGITTNGQTGKDTIVSFESLYTVPKKLIARIGFSESDLSFYFAELSGRSAVHALKAYLTETFYTGFSGVTALGTKAKFDPTPNRNWKVIEARYDLRRGLTAEALDIQSWQFDGLDEAGAQPYWEGCIQPTNEFGKCNVAPWSQAQVLEILDPYE